MRRPLVVAAFVAGLLVATVVNVAFVGGAQDAADPCQAFRDGDIITIDLSTCEQAATTVAPPTTATTVAPTTTTVAPTTTPPPTTTTAPGPTTTGPIPDGGADFFEDFSTPAGFFDRFNTQVMRASDSFDDGDGDTPGPIPPSDIFEWHGDHNHGCEAPTTLRTIHARVRSESFYWCAPGGPDTGHVMTSMNAAAYVQVNFSPNRTFTNLRRICWDMNQTRMGGRKWIQVTVIPEALFQKNNRSLSYVIPELENGVASGGHGLEGDAVIMSMLTGSTQLLTRTSHEANYDGFQTTDKARRFKHCMEERPDGTIFFELERLPEAITCTLRTEGDFAGRCTNRRSLPGRFPDGQVRVIFSDDTYDSPKGDEPNVGSQNTWHWDNITIS